MLASGIPGARFVPLASNDHLMLADEPGFARDIAEILELLRDDSGA